MHRIWYYPLCKQYGLHSNKVNLVVEQNLKKKIAGTAHGYVTVVGGKSGCRINRGI